MCDALNLGYHFRVTSLEMCILTDLYCWITILITRLATVLTMKFPFYNDTIIETVIRVIKYYY